MKNSYGIPEEKLQKIFKRDNVCVYCAKKMKSHNSKHLRADWYTIEHLNFLPPWSNPETVTICCWSCNSSCGNKRIRDWFKTSYCVSRNINEKTVSSIVTNYIKKVEDNLA